MKNFTLVLFLILSFCSCQKQEQKNMKINISSAQELNLHKLIKEINVFPLETNDSCLIAENHTMQVRYGYTYINNDQKEVLKFETNGEFIWSTLPLRGEGLGNYVIAYSCYVDREENLGIYEVYLPRIQEYTKNLNFKRTQAIEIPNTLSSQRKRVHIKLNDSIYIVKDYKDIHFYNINQHQVIKTIHQEFPTLLGQTTHLMLENYDNKWHYSRSYSCDTLFYLDETNFELKPEIIFDFGGNSFNVNDLPTDMTPQYYQKYLVKTDKILVLEKINLMDKQFCFFIKGDKSYVSCTTNKGTTVYLQNKDNLLPTPQAIENKTFYNLVWPDKLKEYINNELVDKESLKRIHHIKDDDNPVLVCYKLR